MKQGTVSVLVGAHSPVHSLLVLVAWIKLYHELPEFWELACIIVHDWGHWGTQYLDNFEEKKAHWELGANLAKKIFGEKAYNLIRGHCSYYGQPESRLRRPDKYSWLLVPTWWMWTNTIFEPLLIRPGKSRLQSVEDFKAAMRSNWNSGLKEEGHSIYLRQWAGERNQKGGF